MKLDMMTAMYLLLLIAPARNSTAGPLDSVDSIRPRIDATGIQLQPNGRVPESVPSGSDIDAVMAALIGDQLPLDSLTQVRGRKLESEVVTRFLRGEIRVEMASGDVHFRDIRGYATDSANDDEDATLISNAGPLLAALGVSDNEAVVHVRSLARKLKPMDGGPTESQRIARKVVVERVIGGYPVQGEKIVISFARDGTIRKVSSRWHRFNFAKSALVATVDVQRVVEDALQSLERESLERNIVVDDSAAVRLHTFLRPVRDESGDYILLLRAQMDLPVIGPGGTIIEGIDVPVPARVEIR